MNSEWEKLTLAEVACSDFRYSEEEVKKFGKVGRETMGWLAKRLERDGINALKDCCSGDGLLTQEIQHWIQVPTEHYFCC